MDIKHIKLGISNILNIIVIIRLLFNPPKTLPWSAGCWNVATDCQRLGQHGHPTTAATCQHGRGCDRCRACFHWSHHGFHDSYLLSALVPWDCKTKYTSWRLHFSTKAGKKSKRTQSNHTQSYSIYYLLSTVFILFAPVPFAYQPRRWARRSCSHLRSPSSYWAMAYFGPFD